MVCTSNRQSSDNRCGCLFAKGTQTLTDKPKSSAKKKKAAPKDPAAEARKASKKLLKTIQTCLEDAKAEDVIAIDVGNKTSVADHMVIASGRSQRHVSAISDQLSRSLKKAGV
ncbi:MAG: RsfS/YbeB/iojap family protein, partial [Pseudomonadota bacterium]